MKKLIDAIKKALGMSDKPSSDSSSQGFTLIELLVVIAVIGILAAAVLLAVDPVDRINAGNDSRVINDITQVGTAMDAYAVNNNGFYANAPAPLVATGDLRSTPTAPGGYTAYVFTTVPAGCTSGTTCTSVVITGQLKSKKYVNATPSTPVYRYESTTGKKCAVATATTACP